MKTRITALSCLLFFSAPSQAIELSGNISSELRYFPDSPVSFGSSKFDRGSSLSFSFAPEIYHEWSRGERAIIFSPFLRWDESDSERTHRDIRELNMLIVQGDWEWRFGLGRVFWGVAESQHLVDIINQTDSIENIDGEDKLGQPMIQASWSQDWGVLDLFVLPGFRERTFAGERGRLRAPLVVDTDNPVYESKDEDRHIDYAVRWSHSLGVWDVGLSNFYGTSRTPELRQRGYRLIPHYNLINQTGLDLQATLDEWILKLESIYRIDQRKSGDKNYAALVGGFEYTFVGAFETDADVGWLVEYHYDDRKKDATTPFQNDLFTAVRVALNDAQSSELLAGAFIDLDRGGYSLRFEANRRIGDRWKLTLEYQGFNNIDPDDVLYAQRQEDYLQAELSWFF